MYNETLNFGSYLNDLLTLKGIDKKHFAAALNINRSLLYRYLSSEQLPNQNQLNDIIEKLNIKGSRHKKLLESYECTLYGWEIVNGRKLIINMLNSLESKTQTESITYEYKIKKPEFFDRSNGVVPIKSRALVINTILSLLDSARKNSDISTVRIIFNPDNQDFVNVLSKILNELTRNKKDISIKHIFRLKDTLLKKNKLHNLKILDTVFPFSFFKDIYGAYCLTENVTPESYKTFFPNFISVDSKTAFAFSKDLENGIFYDSKCQNVIKLMNEEFEKICDDCLPLFYNLETYEKQSQYMYDFEHMVQAETAILHPESSIYTITSDIIRKKEKEKLIEKKHAQLLIERIELFQERMKKGKALEIISLAGIKNFVETGQPQLYKAIKFNKSERVEILNNLLKFVQKEKNYTLYIMKEDHPFYDSDFAVYTIGSELLCIVPSFTNFANLDNILIRNRGIVETFSDFLHSNYIKKNSITEKNEVAEVISNVIDSI